MHEFRLPDLERRYSSVRLDAGLGTAGPRPELTWADGVWSVAVDLPPLHRIEYGFEVTGTITDPANPLRVDSGFGDRSVLEMPGYEAPAWVAADAPEGTTAELACDVEGVTAALWSPAGLRDDDPAPLVVVHDGPDYAARGLLTRYLAVLADEDGPTARALLLAAHPRARLYAADAAYADALVAELIPSVTDRYPTSGRVAVGASLGALAALHAQWRHPGTFDGLLLQSGSFFMPATDGQEEAFPGWDAVTGFIDQVHSDDPAAAALPPTALTCGAHEENAANNALLAARLREVGVPVTYTQVADLHNFTCWRDSLHPALQDLLLAASGG